MKRTLALLVATALNKNKYKGLIGAVLPRLAKKRSTIGFVINDKAGMSDKEEEVADIGMTGTKESLVSGSESSKEASLSCEHLRTGIDRFREMGLCSGDARFKTAEF